MFLRPSALNRDSQRVTQDLTRKGIGLTHRNHLARAKTKAASREALQRSLIVTAVTALTAAIAIAMLIGAVPAKAQDISVAELARSGGLKDIVQGDENAKVTVIEYASMSCGHCATFHADVYPKLKEQYIDTGKIRFIFREFPLDNRAAAASMLARCVAPEKTTPLIKVLFKQLRDWAYVAGDPTPKLFEIAKQAGFTEKSFKACLTNEEQFQKLIDGRRRASTVFGINSTPTFFINGQRLKGAPTLEALKEVIDPMLAKS